MILFLLAFIFMVTIVATLVALLLMERQAQVPKDIVAKEHHHRSSGNMAPETMNMVSFEADDRHGIVFQNGVKVGVVTMSSHMGSTGDNKSTEEEDAQTDTQSDDSNVIVTMVNDEPMASLAWKEFISPSTQTGEDFGKTCCFDSKFIFISAPNHMIGSMQNTGVVYVFRHDSTKHFRTLFPPKLENDLQFGTTLERIDDEIIIGDVHGRRYHVSIGKFTE